LEYRDIIEDRSEAFDAADEEAAAMLRDLPRRALNGTSLSTLEEQVISLARHDRLGSLEHPGLIGRIIGALFGFRAGSRPLADPKLESVRRAVVVVRHRHHLPDAQVAELNMQGYSPLQVRAIEAKALAA
jgi:hypothetical protein